MATGRESQIQAEEQTDVRQQGQVQGETARPPQADLRQTAQWRKDPDLGVPRGGMEGICSWVGECGYRLSVN